MPSTDIDGSVIVILSEAEARTIRDLLCTLSGFRPLTDMELKIAEKTARDLPPFGVCTHASHASQP